MLVSLNDMKKYLGIPYTSNTPWATLTSYKKWYLIVESGEIYTCLIDHTSDVFATDLAAGRWVLGAKSEQDDFLTFNISMVSEAIEGYCQRKFEQDTYTQSFFKDETTDLRLLQLKHFPIESITTVLLDDGTIVDSDEYRLNKASGKIYRIIDGIKQNWFSDVKKLEVVYVAGYDPIPVLIDGVIKNLVSEAYNRQGLGSNLNTGREIQNLSIPGVMSVAFDFSLSRESKNNPYGALLGRYANVLDPYKSEDTLIPMGDTYVE